MDAPEQTDLEKFIHTQLRKLPDREAPDKLVDNVLAAIAKRKNLPWWKQSFTHWPRHIQCFLFVALGSLFAAAFYGASQASVNVAAPVSERLSAYAWIWRTARTLGEALLLAVGGIPLQWLFAIALVLVLLYGACIAAGFALFRVTARAGSYA
jgi:hypothetical protein